MSRRAAALGIVALLLAANAVAQEDAYRRGYLDALLAVRFPDLGLRTVPDRAPDTVTVHARACLAPSQRRAVRKLLEDAGRVAHVRFDRSADCAHGDPAAGAAAAPLEIRALPEQPLFDPLLADPRQPRFSMSYQRYHTATQSFHAASVAFGEYFGLAEGTLGRAGATEVGIQGAVFALFNLDAPSKDLINADYWIGLPFSYRRGNWSYLVRVFHQSSHLGDEFILGNPGVNRVNLSYEQLEALASYEWERVRVYAGGGYMLHSEPQLARELAHGGIEYTKEGAFHGLDFIAAADVRAAQELDWRASVAVQAGFVLRNTGTHQVRLVLEHFRGHSPNGQFFREPLRYTGVGLYFAF